MRLVSTEFMRSIYFYSRFSANVSVLFYCQIFAKSLSNHEINNQKTLFKAEDIIQSWDRHNV